MKLTTRLVKATVITIKTVRLIATLIAIGTAFFMVTMFGEGPAFTQIYVIHSVINAIAVTVVIALDKLFYPKH